MARAALDVDLRPVQAEVIAKAKICLLDFLSCAFEAQIIRGAARRSASHTRDRDGATVIGTRTLASPGDAAFANAIMGHGTVREDMHAASICHHGVVVWPTLLALSERTPLSGPTFSHAAIIGYEGRRTRSAARSLPAISPASTGRPVSWRRSARWRKLCSWPCRRCRD